jgi:glycosyltransferase involved in cell wall biosynthesis
MDSILEQDYPNLEYIVIDGGSVDGSIEIIQSYEDQLTYWISEADKGQSDAINKGFARATGDIITFCNSDDLYLPGTLGDVAETFQKNLDCGAIVGGFRYIDEKGQFTSGTRMPVLRVETPYDLTLGPPGVYRLHQVATFFTAHALDAAGRFVRTDMKYVLDRELLYRVARRFQIVTREKAYAAFRLHKHSKSVSQILSFAEEFGLLYEQNLSGQQNEDRQRQRLADHHRAKGYLKFAMEASTRKQAALALGRALLYRPGYLAQKGYYARWLRFFGLRK